MKSNAKEKKKERKNVGMGQIRSEMKYQKNEEKKTQYSKKKKKTCQSSKKLTEKNERISVFFLSILSVFIAKFYDSLGRKLSLRTITENVNLIITFQTL